MSTITTTGTRQVLAYVRVSSKRGREGKDNFYSPEDQERLIREFCERRQWEVATVLEAVGQSSKRGLNFQTDEFQALKATLSYGDAIVVARFDRFGRDLASSVRQIEELDALGIEVISASETTGNDAAGKFTRGQFLLMANYQLDRITEGWVYVLDRLHGDGVTHGVAPFGYDRPTENGKPQRLVPNADAPVVRYLFRNRAQGASWWELIDSVEELTGRRFSPQGVRLMLRNKVYLGEVRRGKRPVVKLAHEPLVTEQEFLACQRESPKRERRRGDSLLSGLVRCACCEGGMYEVAASYKTKTATKTHRSYACHNRGCTGYPSISADWLDERVLEAWMPTAQMSAARLKSHDADTSGLELACLEADEDVRAWMRNSVAQRADESAWADEMERRAEIKRKARRKLDAAQAKASFGGLTATLLGEWDKMNNTQRRLLIAASIECVIVRPANGKRRPDLSRITIAPK